MSTIVVPRNESKHCLQVCRQYFDFDPLNALHRLPGPNLEIVELYVSVGNDEGGQLAQDDPRLQQEVQLLRLDQLLLLHFTFVVVFISVVQNLEVDIYRYIICRCGYLGT